MFVARVAGPGEQSVAGGLFQTLTQLGTALGLAVTTIVHNSVLKSASGDDSSASVDEDASRAAQLKAYHAAQWAAFAFGVSASVLAAIFLRGVGVIGDRHGHHPSPPKGDLEKEMAVEKSLPEPSALTEAVSRPAHEKENVPVADR